MKLWDAIRWLAAMVLLAVTLLRVSYPASSSGSLALIDAAAFVMLVLAWFVVERKRSDSAMPTILAD
jgi:hypothetical protein